MAARRGKCLARATPPAPNQPDSNLVQLRLLTLCAVIPICAVSPTVSCQCHSDCREESKMFVPTSSRPFHTQASPSDKRLRFLSPLRFVRNDKGFVRNETVEVLQCSSAALGNCEIRSDATGSRGNPAPRGSPRAPAAYRPRNLKAYSAALSRWNLSRTGRPSRPPR